MRLRPRGAKVGSAAAEHVAKSCPPLPAGSIEIYKMDAATEWEAVVANHALKSDQDIGNNSMFFIHYTSEGAKQVQPSDATFSYPPHSLRLRSTYTSSHGATSDGERYKLTAICPLLPR